MNKAVTEKLEELNEICRNHSVKYLYLIGTDLRDDYDINKSDIDFVVEVDEEDPVESGDKLMSLWDELEFLFSTRVDLLTNKSITNAYLKKNIDNSKVLIYEKPN